MTGFDLLLLVLLPVVAYLGWRLGFLMASSSFGGFMVGVLVGLAVAPTLIESLRPGLGRALLAFVVVLGSGLVLQMAGSLLGNAVRQTITGRRWLRLDAFLGAAGAVITMLGFVWLIGAAADRAGEVPFAGSVRDSAIVSAVSSRVPLDSDAVLATFGTMIDRSGFPAVLSDTGLERLAPVPPPDPSVLSRPGIQAAVPSIVKVVASATQCRRGLEGSGSVVAPGQVLTNAHVVAGADQVRVFIADSVRPYAADVVVFDPQTDVAVLAVPDLEAPVLAPGPELPRGAEAVVAGYPGDGPLLATAARVRGHLRAVGADIYGADTVERDVYALRTAIRSGNSGGPLLDAQGRWVGLVFAASADDGSTGYALRPSALAADLAAARSAVGPVSTRSCTP